MLVSLIYSVYIKVLMGDEKDGFDEFLKNFIKDFLNTCSEMRRLGH